MIIIQGIHEHVEVEYFWRASKRLIKGNVKKGDKIWVDTKFGMRVVTVTEVRERGKDEPKPTRIAVNFTKESKNREE